MKKNSGFIQLPVIAVAVLLVAAVTLPIVSSFVANNKKITTQQRATGALICDPTCYYGQGQCVARAGFKTGYSCVINRTQCAAAGCGGDAGRPDDWCYAYCSGSVPPTVTPGGVTNTPVPTTPPGSCDDTPIFEGTWCNGSTLTNCATCERNCNFGTRACRYDANCYGGAGGYRCTTNIPSTCSGCSGGPNPSPTPGGSTATPAPTAPPGSCSDTPIFQGTWCNGSTPENCATCERNCNYGTRACRFDANCYGGAGGYRCTTNIPSTCSGCSASNPTSTPTPASTGCLTSSTCATLFERGRAALNKSCGDSAYDKVVDFNRDRKVDNADAREFALHCSEATWCANRLADTTDPCVQTTSTPPPARCLCPNPATQRKDLGDANCDGEINIQDYTLWRSQWEDHGTPVSTTVGSADFNCDNVVDLQSDYALWYSNTNIWTH